MIHYGKTPGQIHVGPGGGYFDDGLLMNEPVDSDQYSRDRRLYVYATIDGFNNPNIRTVFAHGNVNEETYWGKSKWAYMWVSHEWGNYRGDVKFELRDGERVRAVVETHIIGEFKFSIGDCISGVIKGRRRTGRITRIHYSETTGYYWYEIRVVYPDTGTDFSMVAEFEELFSVIECPNNVEQQEGQEGQEEKPEEEVDNMGRIFTDEELLAMYDINNSGNIDSGELLQAKYDWSAAVITHEDFGAVIEMQAPDVEPCTNKVCEPVCIGQNRYETECENGICLTGGLMEANSPICGGSTPTPTPTPTPIPTPDKDTNWTLYIIIAIIAGVALMVLY